MPFDEAAWRVEFEMAMALCSHPRLDPDCEQCAIRATTVAGVLVKKVDNILATL